MRITFVPEDQVAEQPKIEVRGRLMCFTVGRSMEEEARLILREAVDSKAGPENLATAIRDRFAPFAGVGPNRSLRSGRRPYKYPMGPLRSSVQDYSFG